MEVIIIKIVDVVVLLLYDTLVRYAAQLQRQDMKSLLSEKKKSEKTLRLVVM